MFVANLYVYVLLILFFGLNFSEIREVPDNQEVFIDIETDQSIIVELLELEGRGGDELIR